MTSKYVILSIKLCLDAENNEDIIVSNFGGSILNGVKL